MPKLDMVNLSIGYNMGTNKDPAGMCVIYTDENKVAHIQNLVLGDKAELIYRLLTTPSSEYAVRERRVDDYHTMTEIQFLDRVN